MPLTFSQLEAFLAVVEHGGVGAAARQLGVTQSAVSHALRALQSELGAELFGTPPALTAAGQAAVVRAREMLLLQRTLKTEARHAQQLEAARLRIGSLGVASSAFLLPRLIHAFHTTHPGVTVEVEEGTHHEVVIWLQERRVDLGFVVTPHEGLDTVDLGQDVMVALLPSGHPLATQQEIALRQIAHEPLIMPAARRSRGDVEALFRQGGLHPLSHIRVRQVASIVGMVRQGLGWSVMSSWAVPPGDAGVCAVPLSPRRGRSIGLGMLDSARASAAAKAFVASAQGLRTTLQP